jgi:hypothetical protein
LYIAVPFIEPYPCPEGVEVYECGVKVSLAQVPSGNIKFDVFPKKQKINNPAQLLRLVLVKYCTWLIVNKE